MTATPEDLLGRFDELGLNTTTHRHPPVYTVDESKRLRGDLPGAHCKNLFLKDAKGALWLLVTLEDRKLDLKDVRRRIGSAPLSFGKPDLLREVFGIEPGAVTPFAVINDVQGRVTVVLERSMMERPLLNYHPLTNAATTAITPDDFLVFLRACGHEPQIADL